MKKLQSTDSRVIEAVKLYNSGQAIKPICKILKMDGETLRNILRSQNLLRTRGQAGQCSKLSGKINHDALDTLSPEACYWIGFLYADGHIEKDRPRISVTLSSIDHNHLVKFINFFGAGLTIRVLGSGHHRVAFSSPKIYEKLITLGFTSRKSYAIIPHEDLKKSRDFWRGCIDGDGWICDKKQQALGLCGHKNTLVEFLMYICNQGIITKAQPHKVKKRDHLWTLDLHNNVCNKVMDILYKDSTVYLDRKYQTYLNIK